MHVYFDGIEICTPLMLAAMAVLGYVFGTLRKRRDGTSTKEVARLRNNLSRAKFAIGELQKIADSIQESTTKYHSLLQKFQSRVASLDGQPHDDAWRSLYQEVEELLDPTFHLVSSIAGAQERIRYQSNYLLTFSEMRTDPLTGLGNRRALDHVLSAQLGVLRRYGAPFSLAVIDIDNFKLINDRHGHQHGDRMLCDLAKLLQDALREVDILARYGGDELVIVMPHTEIAGAELLCERLRVEVQRRLPLTISVGVAAAHEDDTRETLFKRTDVALYQAKSTGRNRTCAHSGAATPPATVDAPPRLEDADVDSALLAGAGCVDHTPSTITAR